MGHFAFDSFANRRVENFRLADCPSRLIPPLSLSLSFPHQSISKKDQCTPEISTVQLPSLDVDSSDVVQITTEVTIFYSLIRMANSDSVTPYNYK